MNSSLTKKPKILETKNLYESKMFYLEQLQIQFGNGEKRIYERIKGKSLGAVLVVPIDEQDNLLLIREYTVGSDRYELYFPKGKIDDQETPLETAQRELQEEVGFGAKQLTYLKQVTAAPGFMSRGMDIILAKDLYQSRMQGDEPEALTVVNWPLKDYKSLLQHPEFTEGRSIAALLLALNHLEIL